MAWVPVQQSSIPVYFASLYGRATLNDSIVSCYGKSDGWDLNPTDGNLARFRVSVLTYSSPSTSKRTNSELRTNQSSSVNPPEYVDSWYIDPVYLDGSWLAYTPPWEPNNTPSQETYQFLIEVWDESGGGGGSSGSSTVRSSNYVYEMEKGWSFDGNFIPHFAVFNWYFGDNPVDYTSIQKIRVHGLSHGRAFLQVATTGIQQDGYDEELTEPQWLDLPRNPQLISENLDPKTNYADAANRGLAIQMMFSGRNQDITKPEPKHVLQVLVVQGSPPGTGFRSN